MIPIKYPFPCILTKLFLNLTNIFNTLFTLAPWPWPSEVLFTLGELYPRQTGQPREDCLSEDLGRGSSVNTHPRRASFFVHMFYM